MRLAAIVEDLRGELGAGEVPFVAGTLGGFLKETNPDGTPNYWPLVNRQIASLPVSRPGAPWSIPRDSITRATESI